MPCCCGWTGCGKACFHADIESEHAIISDQGLLSAEDEAQLEATLQRIAESHGYVSNLMQTVALAPEGLAALAALATYTCHGLRLTERQKQLAIVIALRDVHYGWAHHAPQARAVGVTEEQLLRLREGRTPPDMEASERALCAYAFEITSGRRVPPQAAEQLHAHFSPRQIVDIALLIAHAMSVAALALGLEVPLETPEVLQFELDWQRRRMAG